MALRGFQSDIVDNWALGVITAVLEDRLPDGAVPYCRNGQFYDIGPERAIFGTRKGAEVINTTALSGAVVSQYCLKTDSHTYHLGVLANGDLGTISGNTFSVLQAALFSNITGPFSWQTANDRAYVTNGHGEMFKTDGVTVEAFGIQQPASGDWSASAVAGGVSLPADTYDLVIQYSNSDTGTDGPISDEKTVVITAGQKIHVTLPSAGTINDGQVDFIKISIRARALSNELFFVAAGASPAPTTTKGWAIGVSPVDIDSSSAQLVAFTILAPGVNDNYPPPTETLYLVNHKSRMVAVTADSLYWSEIDDPENFNRVDRFIPVGEEHGLAATGAAVLSDVVVVFHLNKVYGLVGDDPQTWIIQLLDNTVGCVGYNSIATFDNKLFWMSLRGPRKWNSIGSDISDITTQLVGPEFDATHVDPDDLATTVVVGSSVDDWVGWAITPINESTNSLIIPFNYKLERWMSDGWNMVDVKSHAQVYDSTGRQWPMVGDDSGFVYKVGAAELDGIPNGTATTGTVTSGTATTLTDATQNFTNNLTGRFLYKWNAVVGAGGGERRKITSNTTTTFTTAAWDVTPAAGDNYAIGNIVFDWRTGFRNGGSDAAFYRKRIEFCFIELATDGGAVDYNLRVYANDDSDTPIVNRTETAGSGFMLDVDMLDVGMLGSGEPIVRRIPIRVTGYDWSTQLTQVGNGDKLLIYRNATQWLTKTKKPGNG